VRFSVVVPLYNKRLYVCRAVDSVLSQSFRDFELIVIDDGSTDGSHETLADISDSRMRLIRQNNAGQGAARNRGVEEARADWIAFLDADDMWLSGHLDEMDALVERFPETGIVSTNYREIVDGTGFDPAPRRTSNMRKIDYFAEAARGIGIINASNVAVNRAAIRSCGGFGAFRAGEDLECWAKLALNHPVAVSDRITSCYFRGTGGAMEQLHKARTRDLPRGLEDISPSVKLLTRALRDGSYKARTASIEAYINSRLVSGVKGALYLREIGLARRAAGFAIGNFPPYLRFLQYFLRLPDFVILWATEIYATGRNLPGKFFRRRAYSQADWKNGIVKASYPDRHSKNQQG
jgi:glycosyltransferase involved in cell wall biosynthesis